MVVWHLYSTWCSEGFFQDADELLMEHSSRYQQPVEMCHSFPSSHAMSRNTSVTYQRQMSEPCLPYHQQGFKREYHDPMYDQANHMGRGSAHRYPGNLVIKQEQTDYAYDSVEKALKEVKQCTNLSLVTDCMEHALTAQHPRTRYGAGWDAKLIYIPLSYFPTWFADAFLTSPYPLPTTHV